MTTDYQLNYCNSLYSVFIHHYMVLSVSLQPSGTCATLKMCADLVSELMMIVLPSCFPQPALWVSSSQVQRDNAQAVHYSATPPPRGHQCVCVDLDTCVQNLTLPTLHALVSIYTFALTYDFTHKYRGAKHLLTSSHSLPFPCSSSLLFLLSLVLFLFSSRVI